MLQEEPRGAARVPWGINLARTHFPCSLGHLGSQQQPCFHFFFPFLLQLGYFEQ